MPDSHLERNIWIYFRCCKNTNINDIKFNNDIWSITGKYGFYMRDDRFNISTIFVTSTPVYIWSSTYKSLGRAIYIYIYIYIFEELCVRVMNEIRKKHIVVKLLTKEKSQSQQRVFVLITRRNNSCLVLHTPDKYNEDGSMTSGSFCQSYKWSEIEKDKKKIEMIYQQMEK